LIRDKNIPELIKENFPECLETALAEPLLIGDFMKADPLNPDAIDPMVYQDCGTYQ